MDQYFLAILMPEDTGGWTVLFPDLPGCATHGATVQEAQARAAEVLDLHLAALNEDKKAIPVPRNLQAVQTDAAWTEGRGIDWSKVLISLIKTGRNSDTHHAT
jgi:predicted RNase H-like HicB family nuclease